MSTLNKLFDKIYVLTIDRNIDRQTLVKEHLKGIDFEFWYGIDVPKEFTDIEFVADIPDSFFNFHNIDKNYVSAWTKGQLGAYTSIMEMVKEATKYEFVLIFEDDFLAVKEDWVADVEQALKELPNNWDILMLGYFYYGRCYKLAYNRNSRWVFNLVNTFKNRLFKSGIKKVPTKFSKNLDKAGKLLGGHAYCLSKGGAQKLAEQMNPMRVSGDNLVEKMILNNSINAYTIYPCLFKQNDIFESKTIILDM